MASIYVSAPLPGATGVGVGGSCASKMAFKAGASKPAYVHVLPWQPLLEQNEVLLTPPASAVVWQLEQVLSNTWRCRAIQFALRCDCGSGPRLHSMSATE